MKPVTLEYCGPHDSVTVPEFDLDRGIARGEAVEFPAELAERLLAQAGNWRRPGAKRSPAAEGSENP